jgi:hypothetical protein
MATTGERWSLGWGEHKKGSSLRAWGPRLRPRDIDCCVGTSGSAPSLFPIRWRPRRPRGGCCSLTSTGASLITCEWRPRHLLRPRHVVVLMHGLAAEARTGGLWAACFYTLTCRGGRCRSSQERCIRGRRGGARMGLDAQQRGCTGGGFEPWDSSLDARCRVVEGCRVRPPPRWCNPP